MFSICVFVSSFFFNFFSCLYLCLKNNFVLLSVCGFAWSSVSCPSLVLFVCTLMSTLFSSMFFCLNLKKNSGCLLATYVGFYFYSFLLYLLAATYFC
jgi:hypothetical protein